MHNVLKITGDLSDTFHVMTKQFQTQLFNSDELLIPIRARYFDDNNIFEIKDKYSILMKCSNALEELNKETLYFEKLLNNNITQEIKIQYNKEVGEKKILLPDELFIDDNEYDGINKVDDALRYIDKKTMETYVLIEECIVLCNRITLYLDDVDKNNKDIKTFYKNNYENAIYEITKLRNIINQVIFNFNLLNAPIDAL